MLVLFSGRKITAIRNREIKPVIKLDKNFGKFNCYSEKNMKEIKSIVEAYRTVDFSTTRAALATVARVEGSSYRRAGARMLVLDNGTYLGGISGGCLEGDALRRAQKAIALDKPSVITYDTTQDDEAQIGVGLGCNGIIDVLFTPLHENDEKNPIHILSTLTGTREPKLVVSITGCDDALQALGKCFLYKDEQTFMNAFPVPAIASQVLGDIKNAAIKQASATFNYSTREHDDIKVFIEVIMPVIHLVLYGGNYDIYPLIRIGKELGWEVSVVTNIQKAAKELFGLATKVLDSKSGEKPVIDDYTATILMAHDYKTDFNNLQRALATKASYIGMLGPRKRSDKMFDALVNDGNAVSNENKQRIFSPAGLDIGAATPEEIALAICAEIRSVFAGRTGSSLRLREGTIYGN